jgi:dipeptidyl aminopeptidase/acylaminoacyl peptidase
MGREVPNPAISAEKPEQAIWFAGVDGSQPKKLTEGSAPEVCGSTLKTAFIRKGQVFYLAGNGKEAKALLTVNGSVSDLTCSPDRSMLAFVNGRTTHSLIAIYSIADRKLRYLDPGVDSDGAPAWSPDSSKIAFLRIPASSRAFAFGPVREAQPFSIRIADVKSGAGRELWRADPGQGSAFHDIVAKKQIFWAAGDRIVFPWEKTGWEQLYSVPAGGGKAKLLTPGQAEVEDVALSSDKKTIYFSSNRDDIDRRHLWNVIADGSAAPSAITSGNGIEWQPAPVSDGSGVAFLASDARHKSHASIRLSGTKTIELAPDTIPADYPAQQLIEPKQVIFSAADGMQIHAQLFLPPQAHEVERLPAVVFFHGGSRRQMLLGFHYRYYYSNAYALNEYLASKGYIVLSVNYRSGIGYGMKFREALNYGATGASEFNDVLGAGLYLRGRSDVDPNRIGVWGGSYGGYLTALGLSRASDLFKAGVDFHGVHDWNNVIHNFVPQYDPKAAAEAARVAFASSPMSSLDSWRSPVLLIQGDDDRNVPFTETIRLVEQLRKKSVDYELMVIPNEVHDFLLYQSWVRAYEATEGFFDRKLK